MTDKLKTVAAVVVAAAFIIGMNVMLVKFGEPQSVWLYCDMLGWCDD